MRAPRCVPGARVGAYTLHSVLGIGAVGEVWRATHPDRSQPVALKLVEVHGPTQISYLTEVRAAARLDHPHLQAILDAGRSKSLPGFAEGATWLAGEIAAGTLRDLNGLRWPDVADLVHQILSGLAHAHARGIVHRDLKPANVLYRIREERRHFRLADFGVADLGPDARDPARGSTGTPLYMAPEQAAGAWRDQGPWTDLYALGCIVHEIVGGGHPFAGLDDDRVRRGQRGGAWPRLSPAIEVPDGLVAWVERCLAVAPGDRFRSSAAARDALSRWTPDYVPWTAGFARSTPSNSVALLTLRDPPVVGRAAECDQLTAEAIAATEACRVVVLRGAPGMGRRRLARWICEASHEHRGATVLHATWSGESGAGEGVVAMLERGLRCEGLSPAGVVDRLSPQLGATIAQQIAARIHPAGVDGLCLRTPAQRTRATVRALSHLSGLGPLVVWFDGLGRDERRLLAALAEASPPILILCTLSSDAPTVPVLHRRIDVGPLGPQGRRDLVLGRLAACPDLVTRIDEIADGSPLFTVQLIHHLVETQQLRTSPAGIALVAGVDPSLPDGDVWTAGIRRAEAEAGSGGAAVELGAVLGMQVAAEEWAAVAHGIGEDRADDALDAWIRRGLVVRHRGGGWTWSHGVVRQAVLDRVVAEGRRPALCAVAADIVDAAAAPERVARLLRGAGDDSAAVDLLWRAAIRATHRSEDDAALGFLAEMRDAAGGRGTDRASIEATIVEARIRQRRGDHREVLIDLDQAIVDAEPWPSVQADALCAWSTAARRQGRTEDARTALHRALALFGDDEIGRARVFGLLADVSEPAAAEALTRRAVAALQGVPAGRDSVLFAHMVLRLGNVAARRGDRGEALARYGEALAAYEVAGHVGMQVQTRIAIAGIHTGAGALDEARQLLARAREQAPHLDQPFAWSMLEGGEALLALETGDRRQAEVFARRSVKTLFDAGSRHRISPYLLLLILLADRRQDGELRALVDRLERTLEVGLDEAPVLAHVVLLATTDPAVFEARFPALEDLVGLNAAIRRHLDRALRDHGRRIGAMITPP